MADSPNEKIGDVVQRGILLFSQVLPFPAASLIAAIAAALTSKGLELHQRRVSEVLSQQLELQHISYVEPDDQELLRFFSNNPIYSDLAAEFEPEIKTQNFSKLRGWYPYLYSVLILQRQIPALLFHEELQEHKYRKLVEHYERLSKGFESIQGDAELQLRINRFAKELLEVLNEVYEAVKAETENDRNQLAFEIIDYIRDIARA